SRRSSWPHCERPAGRRSGSRSRRATTRSGCSGPVASRSRRLSQAGATGGSTVLAVSERVPGDISAAAFWLVAGAIHPDAELTLRGVGVNPTRRAVIDILASMGADLTEVVERPDGPAVDGGEPIADIAVRSSELRAIDLGPRDVAAAIDEIPVLCLAAALADGTTHIRGAGELRHKESDRIAGIAAGLAALGARIDVDGDDLAIHGRAALRGASTD